MGRRRNKQAERIVARRRIRQLLEAARRRLREGEPVYAKRAVALARRLAMRYQTGLRAEERDRICECGTILIPGNNARVRLRAGAKRLTCLECGAVKRRGYRREQKERRLQRARQREQEKAAPDVPLVQASKTGGSP